MKTCIQLISLFIFTFTLGCKTKSGTPDTPPSSTVQEDMTEDAGSTPEVVVDTRTDEHKDMDVICDEITALVALEQGYADVIEEGRQKVMYMRVFQQIQTEGVYNLWRAMETTEPPERYELLISTADYMGIKGWTCPPIKELWP